MRLPLLAGKDEQQHEGRKGSRLICSKQTSTTKVPCEKILTSVNPEEIRHKFRANKFPI